ncbi:MAG: hypothetical protein AAB065_04975, partial [Deltaproteobacteria bacterium]
RTSMGCWGSQVRILSPRPEFARRLDNRQGSRCREALQREVADSSARLTDWRAERKAIDLKEA